MARMSAARAAVVAVAGVLLLAPAAWAQEAGIAGVVKDNTGAVLPGVTVTVASPVLIERQRVVITDAEGRYSVTQLRPGVYSVTFTLTGFTTVVREDLRLSAGFTATIEAELRVGGVAETITVSGASPVVDLENVRRQQVVTTDLLESLPMSTKSIASMANLTTGVSGLGTVGGGYQIEPGADEISGGGSFHGKAGTKVSFDGMVIENSSGNSSYQLNAAAVEEMVMSTSGISADTNADGLVVNVIPKDGSNTFKTILNGAYSNSSMEGHNLTPDLIERGLLTGPKTIKLFDESVSLGGPIVRDRLWFFVAPRSWGFAKVAAGTFWNKTQDQYLTPPGADLKVVKFTPWVDRPEDRESGRLEWYQSVLSRVTWQATAKNKFGFTYDEQRGCNCYSLSSNTAQEAFLGSYYFDPNRLIQGTWSAPVTNKLLLEAGAAATISTWNMFYHPGVRNDVVNVNDLGTGIQYGSSLAYLGHPNARDRYTQRASMSYVTGSHNFKTGFLMDEARTDTYWHVNGNVNYLFYNGAPLLIAQWSTPYEEKANTKAELGIYAQDQWKVTNKLTLNLGLRWDYFNSYVPPQTSGFPGETDGYWVGSPTVNPWLGPRSFAPIYNVPNWKDWNPRLGAAYDLFGNGKTALKVSAGRYVVKMSTDEFAGALANPINRSINYSLRSWSDSNGDYVPDCNLGNFQANGECGANTSPLGAAVNTTNFDPAVLTGYGKRDSNWDIAAEVQHELRRGVGVTAGYYYNNGGYTRSDPNNPYAFNSKVRVTQNLLTTPADFDSYCITAPRDPNLPGGGGNQVCGLANLKPEKVGQVSNLITSADKFGTFKTRNDFFSATIDARIVRGIRLGGGADTGRSLADRCFVVNSVQDLLNCRVVTPFKAQTQFKAHGIFPIPGKFVASFIYQNLSGPTYNATYAVQDADALPSLGRPLSGGSVDVPLVQPWTLFEARISRLDLRLSKNLRISRLQVQLNLDVYNALNANSIQADNNRYGPGWRRPLEILDPRLFQVGGQISF